MTIIAGFFREGCPILFGDLLVSDDDPSNREFTFPTVGKVYKRDISNGDFSPSRLCQKTILISPKLAVCWADKKIYANCFIKEVIKANCHVTPSHEQLSSIYRDIGGPGNLEVIGLYRNGTEMRIFDFECLAIESPVFKFDYFKAVGSGYLSLLQIASELHTEVSESSPNKLETGISTALSLITSLLAREVIAPSSLNDLFGVGYEIVHPLGAELSKFTNLTYLFWVVQEEEPGRWQMPPYPILTLNYSYVRDILVIRGARISSVPLPSACKVDSDELHFVTPIHRSFSPNELAGYSPSSFNSEWVCNVFLWKNHKTKVGAFASLGCYHNQTPPVIWTNEFTKNECINVNTSFIQTTLLKIATVCQQR